MPGKLFFLATKMGESLLVGASLADGGAAGGSQAAAGSPARKRRRLSPSEPSIVAEEVAATSGDDAAAVDRVDASVVSGNVQLQMWVLDRLAGYGPIRDMLLAEAAGAVSVDDSGTTSR